MASLAALAIPTAPTPGHSCVVHDATLLALTSSYFKLSFFGSHSPVVKRKLTFYVKVQLYRSSVMHCFLYNGSSP